MTDLINRFKVADLPNEDVQFLADVIGLEAVLKLLVTCKGMTFYIPSKLPTKFTREYILANYTPEEPNTKALARTLKITERRVWQVLGRRKARPPRARHAA